VFSCSRAFTVVSALDELLRMFRARNMSHYYYLSYSLAADSTYRKSCHWASASITRRTLAPCMAKDSHYTTIRSCTSSTSTRSNPASRGGRLSCHRLQRNGLVVFAFDRVPRRSSRLGQLPLYFASLCACNRASSRHRLHRNRLVVFDAPTRNSFYDCICEASRYKSNQLIISNSKLLL